MNQIQAQGLTMRYGDVTALDCVDITFESQKIYGLLGRNGAGKTTLLNLLSNRLCPTEGQITVDGEIGTENDRAQGKIFYMGEKSIYPDNTNVKKMFRWAKMFYPNFDTEYANRLAEIFSLPLKKNYRKFRIRSFEGQDDFRSLAEIIGRRIDEYQAEPDSVWMPTIGNTSIGR